MVRHLRDREVRARTGKVGLGLALPLAVSILSGFAVAEMSVRYAHYARTADLVHRTAEAAPAGTSRMGQSAAGELLADLARQIRAQEWDLGSATTEVDQAASDAMSIARDAPTASNADVALRCEALADEAQRAGNSIGLLQDQVAGASLMLSLLSAVTAAIAGVFAALGIILPAFRARDHAEFQVGTTSEGLQAQSEEIARLSAEVGEARGVAREALANLQDLRRINEANIGRTEAIFHSLSMPIFSLNELGRVVEWNHACVALFGYDPHEVIDRPLTEIMSLDTIDPVSEAVRTVGRGEQVRLPHYKLTLAGGQVLHLDWIATPIKNQHSAVVGSIHAVRDLTPIIERERLAARLEQLSKLVTQAQDAVSGIFPVMSWYEGEGADKILAQLGYPQTTWDEIKPNLLVHLLHPQDASPVNERNKVFATAKNGTTRALDLRLRRSDGTYASLRSLESVVETDDFGKATLVAGYIYPREVTGGGADAKLVLSALAERCGQGVVLLNEYGAVQYMNDLAREYLHCHGPGGPASDVDECLLRLGIQNVQSESVPGSSTGPSTMRERVDSDGREFVVELVNLRQDSPVVRERLLMIREAAAWECEDTIPDSAA